jgi:hypothetical protein
MPTQQPAHRSPPYQLVLPFDRPQQQLFLPRSLNLIPLSPTQVWNTLTPEQQSDLRHQLIQILQEVIPHASQHR